jgi:predicted Zn-dependent protease
VTKPALTAQLEFDLQQTTYSFRRLSNREAAALRPQRLAVIRVRPGDTVAQIARSMPFDDLREERFRVLNGLGPNDRLQAGQLVKTIVE